MASEPVRDPLADHLLTPQNCVLDRIAQAGGQPTSVTQVGCELQRDWARGETAEGFQQILFGGERALAGAAR